MTIWKSWAAASCTRRVAWPRAFVSWTSSLKSAARAFSIASTIGRVTDLATGFTIVRARSGLRGRSTVILLTPAAATPPPPMPSSGRSSSARSPSTTTEPLRASVANRSPKRTAAPSTTWPAVAASTSTCVAGISRSREQPHPDHRACPGADAVIVQTSGPSSPRTPG